MDFGAQIKKVRTEHALTQKALAEQLNVSRQTISSWENNVNLPDLETIVTLANLFHLSLDELILGDEKVERKLVTDGNKMRRVKLNLISSALVCLGFLCFFLRVIIGEHIDQNGVLHEPFFLVLLGFLLFFLAFLVILVSIVKWIYQKIKTIIVTK